MNRRSKKENAITLIALVVTIVVLLILAGVSISMLTGDNGIITQAQEAKENTRGGEVKEKVEMAANENKMLDYTSGTKKEKQDVIDELVADKKLTDKEVELLETEDVITIGDIEIDFSILGENPTGSIAGKTYDDETDIKVGDVPVTVPGGATISGIPGEYENVDNGLVIYIMKDADGDNKIDTPNWENEEYMQETYDQFVWVPVPNAIATDINEDGAIDTTDIDEMIIAKKYPMAIATGTTTDDDGNTTTNYRGVLYDFVLKDGEVVVSDLDWSADSTSYRESDYLENSMYADGSFFNNTTPKITEDLLQTEFNTMISKVSENKGFWVGRYETSDMSSSNAKDSSQQISVIKGTTTGINSVNWYRMYAQQKNYSNLANITSTSSMIWGSQWDQIMIWMKEEDNESQGSKYIVNSIGMANLGSISGVDDGYSDTSDPSATGCFDVKNVYDLAGNVFDWTLEAYSDIGRVSRRRCLQCYGFI